MAAGRLSGRRLVYAYPNRRQQPATAAVRRPSVDGCCCCCCYCCLPNLLLILLITLFGVAAVQVALFHVYADQTETVGATAVDVYGASVLRPSFALSSPALGAGRLATSAAGGGRRRPAKINLTKLIDRNVPSMAANRRRLGQTANVDAVNGLLARNSASAELKQQQEQLQQSLPPCPVVPANLRGPLHPNVTDNYTANLTEESLEHSLLSLLPGGKWWPSNCRARHQVAVIIPYRQRRHQLLVLLAHLHPILQRQQLNYRLFVVEQYGNETFNKARLMNIGFVTALKLRGRESGGGLNFGCFVFHDVDLIPEDDRNMYSCPEQPRHMSPAIDEFGYTNPYDELVGGVLAIRTEHFFKVNGYSNLYWGWGAEDDDMAYRIQHVGLRISRPPISVARYKTVKHKKRQAIDWRIRYRLLYTGVRRYKIDGLNSLESLNYKVVSIEDRTLFTHVTVDLGPPPAGF